MKLLWMLLWASSFFTLTVQEARLLIFSPSVVRLGVPLSVGLQLQGASKGQKVKGTIFLRNPSGPQVHCSEDVPFILDSDQDFQLLSLPVPLVHVQRCGLNKLYKSNKVQLMAQTSWLQSTLSRKTDTQGVHLLFSSRRGHLFLQTDQPIYNPGQRVRLRVFALNQNMRPSTDTLTITVQNSRGLQVRKNEMFSKRSIFQDEFVIPDISEPGTWRISARFSDSLDSNSSTEFEVKKYVLPNFEVKITPEEPYVLVAPGVDVDIRLNVQAKYVYGKSVQGVAYIRFGILDESGEKKFLRGLEKQSKLSDGLCSITLSGTEIQKALNVSTMDSLQGLRLYVAAAVIESPGGELEEAELTSLRFVSSPFLVDLSSTQQYFVPGTPFLLQGLVQDVSGSSAPGIPVKISTKFITSGVDPNIQVFNVNTDERGHLSILVNIPQATQGLQFTVSAGSSFPAEATLTAHSLPSGGSGLLSIERLDSRPPRVGQTFTLNLRAVGADGATFSHYYYMVLSRGDIISVHRVAKGTVTSISVPVTSQLVPSFRLVAFYYHNGLPVANSLKVDVQAGDCEGKLELKVDGAELRPGDQLKLNLHTDSLATVALGAVDTAVYAAGGQRHRPLHMNKVFTAMNSYDLGCGPGSGTDALQVFESAGLMFSDGHQLTRPRSSLGCPKENKSRNRRNVNFQKAMLQKMNQYSGQAKRCCKDGITPLPMRRSCKDRVARIPEPTCRESFLSCCQFAEELRKKTRTWGSTGLARAQDMWEEEEELLIEDDIVVRSYFPENWLWTLTTVDKVKKLYELVPDSMTTWEIHAVSLSQTKGICVARPVQVRVFQEFHLHFRLPYSVRRFEQLELRPVIYNYLNRDLSVSVQVSPVEGLCLAGGGGRVLKLEVPSNSARPVAFPVVPTASADVSLKVLAQGPFGIGDAVSKVLHIEREGAIQIKEYAYKLNPLDSRGRTFDIPGENPSNVIPDGDFSSVVRVTASEPMETLGSGGALSPGGLGSLLRVPRGCGEQTMVYLSPTLAASRYLDKTEQWDKLPPEMKDHALDLIQKGYTRILQFRKRDGSYGAWLERESSTWLTAFVLKVLSIAQEQVGGSLEGLRETAQWLLTKQLGDGSFQDPCPVLHRDMQGGLVGPDESVALTAFVVVALQQSLTAFRTSEDDPEKERAKELLQRVKASISRADSFLAGKVTTGLLGSHAAAITAYALTLTKAPEDLQNHAHNNIMAMSKGDGDDLYWGPVAGSQSNAISPTPSAGAGPSQPTPLAPALWVETTAYVLLHLLLREGKAEMADQAASWLIRQASFQGGFRSTQDTVVALDALSEYWIASHTTTETTLNVTLSGQGRQGTKAHSIQLNSHQTLGLEENLQFPLGSKITVKVGGNSKGTLKILRKFNILEEKNTTCKDFKLEVTVTGSVQYSEESNDDYEYVEEEEEPQLKDDPSALVSPVTPLQLFEGRRNRRKREVPKTGDEKEQRVHYEVCIWRSDGVKFPGMAIVDITLLSGFHALHSDLEKLTSLSDRYVSHFETQGPHVLLYFDSVSASRDCVGFEAVQDVPVGLVQPASAVLYDYYEPGQKCVVFYGAPSKSKLLSTLCSGDVCQCAEGKCPKKYRIMEVEKMEEEVRMNYACYDPRVHYGFQVEVLRAEDKVAFRLFETRITRVLHSTQDAKARIGQTRNFLVRVSCRLQLEPGKQYLIMGLDGVTFDIKEQPQYLLDSTTWIEEIPSEKNCKALRYRSACDNLSDFLQKYETQGCQV
ncbi:complement C4-A-like [Dromiciops gliroides]|uniref:complement C4-A-like n=1 Tax=Dromiciops gliroides TaxID=33562 RepID=UPI001CC677AF|nr:complement C4-A-like [Dromiciops gliroides]